MPFNYHYCSMQGRKQNRNKGKINKEIKYTDTCYKKDLTRPNRKHNAELQSCQI